MNVTLHFDMEIDIDELNGIDELGKAIATDILGKLYNGEDKLIVTYKGYETSQ